MRYRLEVADEVKDLKGRKEAVSVMIVEEDGTVYCGQVRRCIKCNPRQTRMKEIGLDEQQMNQFIELADALSPENLSCDGELSSEEIQVKQKRLIRKWRFLEKITRKRLTISEVEKWRKDRL